MLFVRMPSILSPRWVWVESICRPKRSLAFLTVRPSMLALLVNVARGVSLCSYDRRADARHCLLRAAALCYARRVSAGYRRCVMSHPDAFSLRRDFMLGKASAPIYAFEDAAALSRCACAVAIGAFDGVHRGHRHLIDQMVADAHERGNRCYRGNLRSRSRYRSVCCSCAQADARR